MTEKTQTTETIERTVETDPIPQPTIIETETERTTTTETPVENPAEPETK